MKSQPQNPEFRNNPENCHPCISAPTLLADVISNGISCNQPIKNSVST